MDDKTPRLKKSASAGGSQSNWTPMKAKELDKDNVIEIEQAKLPNKCLRGW